MTIEDRFRTAWAKIPEWEAPVSLVDTRIIEQRRGYLLAIEKLRKHGHNAAADMLIDTTDRWEDRNPR